MMKKQSSRLPVAPLQKAMAEPVTGSTEQAELDEQRHCQQNAMRAPGLFDLAEPETRSPVVELCRQLPAEDRLPLLARMAAEVSAEAQLDLLEQLATRLPGPVAQQLEEELRVRLANCPIAGQ